MRTLTNHGNAISLPEKQPRLLPLTPRAQSLLLTASDVARSRGVGWVGVDEILIAITRQDKGVAAHVLNRAGVTERQILSVLRQKP